MMMEEIPDHVKAPDCIELKGSNVDALRIGAFCLTKIPKDTEFGPYHGRIVFDKNDGDVDPKYSWEVFDLETFKFLHIVDATDSDNGNWMRYVCCARFFEEQNIVSTQNGEEVYYKALKDIEPGEELLTWFQPKKKKRKRSSIRLSSESPIPDPDTMPESQLSNGTSTPTSPEKVKRKRKPKIYPDSYHGPLEPEPKKSKQAYDDLFEPLQPGQKRRRRKKISTDSRNSSTSGLELEFSEQSEVIREESNGIENPDDETRDDSSSLSASSKNEKEVRKEYGQALSISEINNTVDWLFPAKGNEYLFELRGDHITIRNGKKVYKCDICMGLYKHMFSLKRHYLRNHVNYKYLGKADMTNCLINLSQVIQNMKDRGLEINTSEAQEHEKPSCETKTETEPIDKSDDIEKSVDAEDGENKPDLTEKHITAKEEPDNCSKEEGEEKDLGKADVNEDEVKFDESIESSVLSEEQVNGKNFLDSEHDKSVEQTNKVACEPNQNKESVRVNTENSCNESDPGCIDKETTEEKSEKLKFVEKSGTMPGLFRCYTCYDVFDTVEDVRDHVQNHPQQEEGTCFSCDQCNMRFNYKQNLVRHKKVHEIEGNTENGTNSMHSNSDSAASQASGSVNDSSKPPTGDVAVGVARPPQQPETYQVFKCSKCKTKFESLEEMTAHVKAEHVSGNKFQCQYCGKDFPSMPNMKKHVRFHLGYRVSCRFCPEVFPNVGALRKHTRLSHPDIYKAKLLDKLDQASAAKKLDKNRNSETKITEKSEAVGDNTEDNLKSALEDSKRTRQEEFAYDHEISFAADEIDDGGSRFKFSCTVCKKRFSNYINMCRHRRKSHSNDSKPRHEELSLSFGHKSKNNLSPVQEDPAEVAQFFANVSHNIATNLNCFIDGQPQALKKFVDHIKIEDYSGNFGYNPVETGSLDLTWSKYNFPPNFRPGETVGFTIEKEIVKIPDNIESQYKVEETELQESDKPSDTVGDKSENGEIALNREEESVDMGKKSSGFKMLSGMALSQNNTNMMESKAGNGFFQLKISGGSIECSSPEVKKFIHVEKGEYANFEDDLVPSDINVEVPRSRQNSKSDQYERSLVKDGGAGQSSSSVDSFQKGRKNNESTKADGLLKAAQTELEELYDSIESHEYDLAERKKSPRKRSPEPLSVLCENILGIKKCVKGGRNNTHMKTENGDDCRSESLLLSELSLASQRTAKIKLTNGAKTVVPDYSDVPDGSPFFNYESIAFGTNGQVVSVCAICRKHFKDIEGVLRHHWKKHPGSVFQILEVEQGNGIDSLHFMEPSYVGALAVTDPGLDNINSMETFSCTKCGSMFRSVSKLHVHIVNCSPIDPVYGSSKVERSPSKMSWSKRMQRRLNNLLGNDQGSKSSGVSLTNGVTALESKSQKRMFTGCRKRKSVILPDSPMKATLLPKHLSDLRAGYNPNRHIRRRELTELVDTLTCEACGMKFKTIILLERHVKNCTNKEKFKNVHPLTCPIMDESLARIKNICFYCEKNFTYTKSLINHFQDFCPVKKARLDRGQMTENDKQKEEEIIERVKRLEDEKLVKDPDHVKKKITWQVGRKPKRKGHAWTYIKKKKQMLVSEDGEDGADIDNVDTDIDNVDNDKDNVVSDKDDVSTCTGKDVEKGSETTEDLVEKSDSNSPPVVSDEANNDGSIASDQTCNGFDEVDSLSEMSEQQGSYDLTAVETVEEKEGKEDTVVPKVRENHGLLKETHINDMSLNCTSRYKVNKIIHAEQKHKNNLESSSKPSFIFKCISKTVDEPEVDVKATKKNVPVPQKMLEDTNSLIMRSKRKRERVGKVEEFLRNAFRRRKSSKNVKPEEISVPPKTADENNIRRSESEEAIVMLNKPEQISTAECESDIQQSIESMSDSPANSLSPSEASIVESVRTNSEKLTACLPGKPRKRGRPRKEPSDNEKRTVKPLELRKGGPGRPPSTYVPGKRGRPPKLKVRSDQVDYTHVMNMHATEVCEAENPDSLDSRTETESLSETEPVCDKVNGAIISDSKQIEDESEQSQKEEVKIVILNHLESSNGLTEDKIQVDKHVDSCDTDNDSQDNDSQTDPSSEDTEECLTETNQEGKNQTEGESFTELQQINEVSKDKCEFNEMDIKTEHGNSIYEQIDKTAEVNSHLLKLQDVNTDMMDSEKSKVETNEVVSEMTEYDNSDINSSGKPVQDICEVIKSFESKLPELDEKQQTIEEMSPTLMEDTVINNEVDAVDFSTEQEMKMDMKAEETIAVETDGRNLQHENFNVFNYDTKVPEICKLESDEGEKVSKDSFSNERDSDTVSESIDTEDRTQKERSSSTDRLESSENPDSAIPRSPEPQIPERCEMVLSPSERVKMNKRSCMKGRDSYFPVWVRKQHKPKLKSPERKAAVDSIANDCNKKVSDAKTSDKKIGETNKQSVEVVTKLGENNNPPVMQSPTDKKPVFRNRQEAINENLKLLHKQVTMKFAENIRVRNAAMAAAGAMVNKVSQEKLSSTHGAKNSPSRGIKRKPADRESKDDSDNYPVKRRSVSGKNERSEAAISSPKGVKVNSKQEPKEKESAKDKNVGKAKGVKSMTLEESQEDRPPLRPLIQTNGDAESTPSRAKPMIHPCVDPPVCEDCQKQELSFFDPSCNGCHRILVSPNTKVPDIFAILRQWTPQTQQNLDKLVNEILKRGGHINDRDGLTDMTLLHYASKSGAAGIGDPELAAEVVSMLLARDADPNIRCRWTNMTALHYAAYFDVVPVIKILLKATKALDIDSRCTEFDNGTALHIAASNLAHEAVKVLLQNGANSHVKDEMDRTPIECIPDPTNLDSDPDMPKTVIKLKKTLTEAASQSDRRPPPNYDLVQSKVTLQALGINLGDKVVVGGVKAGTLRYCGPSEFAAGVWAGIELDDDSGKNDGSIGGISYFTCPSKRGIFAPVSKIARPGSSPAKAPSPAKQVMVKQGTVDVSHVTSKVDTGKAEKGASSSTPGKKPSTGLSKSRTSSISSLADIEVGDRVIVAGQRKGTIKYAGETKFAPGIWYGIELDRPAGKNDGSVNSVKYFNCRMKHGVFAPLSRIQKLGDKRFSSNESLETISWGAVSERVDKRSSSGGLLRDGRPKTPNKRPKSVGVEGIMRTPGASAKFQLEVGMSVFCSNELGVVRYIGPTDFGEGVWIGVELRTPKGKNDGSVQGKRYFSCKHDHGLLVRPNKITVRGINGTKLVSEFYGPHSSDTIQHGAANGEVKENGK